MAKPNLFNSVKMTRPSRNAFDLSHDVKLSFNPGELIPTLALEVVPGDKFNIGCESLLRFSPLISPVMHRASVTMHYFFVPNRIIWENWEKYIMNTPSIQHPKTIVSALDYTPLCDYLGIPAPIDTEEEIINPMPFAAYQAIYNEYYRDQNLVTEVDYQLTDGDNPQSPLRVLRKRAWGHDYFTSALPFAQKGAAVEIPVVQQFNDVSVKFEETTPGEITNLDGTPIDLLVDGDTANVPGLGDIWAKTSDLTNTATTINDLRRATKLQEWLEKAARAGTRYKEGLLSFFGVKSPDARLQRPEYITGTKSPVVISEVLNTTGTDDSPQGGMAGHAISVTNGKYGNYYAQEHGWIIGIMSVLPVTAYQQGIEAKFLKTTDPFQYYWPQFAHIGEQPVQNREVYAFQGFTEGSETFGYVPRYAEYKFCQNRVAGEFRTTLNFWHWGRIFAEPPALNEAFITADPSERIFAVIEGADKMYCHVYHKIRAIRPMPKFGTPTF